MTLVDIPPLINMALAIGMGILTIVVFYFALIVGHKQLDLGEKEETVCCGRNTTPICGTYWQVYQSFDRAFHNDK